MRAQRTHLYVHLLPLSWVSVLLYPSITSTQTNLYAHPGTPQAHPSQQKSNQKGAQRDIKRSTPHPEVELCADCHLEQAEGFLQTGMGASLQRARGASEIEHWESEGEGAQKRKVARVTHPRTGVTYEAWIDAEGRWWQAEILEGARLEIEARYIIGSGRQARSYLGLREGELVELPLTWYSERGLWDMSPGYERADHMRMQRPITPDCLFCHNDLTPTRPGTLAGYQEPLKEGISCARCHGEGSAHAQAHLTGEGDERIFNPQGLSAQRQAQLCQQCHLMGATRVLLPTRTWDRYDPQEPLEEQMVVYGFEWGQPFTTPQTPHIPPKPSQHSAPQQGAKQHQGGGGGFGVASHAERLMMSACAQGSTLTCTRCHDPHAPTSPERYQEACLSCHQEVRHTQEATQKTKQADGGVASREALLTSRTSSQGSSVISSTISSTSSSQPCVSCHMLRGETSDIPHVSFTDHWIRVRPTETPPPPKGLWRLKPLTPLPSNEALINALEVSAYTQLARFGDHKNNQHKGYASHAARLAQQWLTDQQEPTQPKRTTHLSFTPKHEGAEHQQTPLNPTFSPLERLMRSSLVHLYDFTKIDIDHAFKEDYYVQYVLNEPALSLKLAAWWMKEGFGALSPSQRSAQLTQAEELLRALISRWPEQRRPYVELANLLQATGRLEEAEGLYLKANALAPNALEVAVNLGALKMSQGALDEAERWLREALRRDPISPAPHYSLALLALERRDLQRAFDEAGRSLKRAHRPALQRQALTLRVELAAALKRYADAEEAVERLISLEPAEPLHYDRLAQLSWERGEPERALKALERGLHLNHPTLTQRHRALKAHLERLRGGGPPLISP